MLFHIHYIQKVSLYYENAHAQWELICGWRLSHIPYRQRGFPHYKFSADWGVTSEWKLSHIHKISLQYEFFDEWEFAFSWRYFHISYICRASLCMTFQMQSKRQGSRENFIILSTFKAFSSTLNFLILKWSFVTFTGFSPVWIFFYSMRFVI